MLVLIVVKIVKLVPPPLLVLNVTKTSVLMLPVLVPLVVKVSMLTVITVMLTELPQLCVTWDTVSFLVLVLNVLMPTV